MTIELNPPDEPCPDCGSVFHRECTLPRWHFGWRWNPLEWRIWYWNFYYDGDHRVVQIIFFQVEYHS